MTRWIAIDTKNTIFCTNDQTRIYSTITYSRTASLSHANRVSFLHPVRNSDSPLCWISTHDRIAILVLHVCILTVGIIATIVIIIIEPTNLHPTVKASLLYDLLDQVQHIYSKSNPSHTFRVSHLTIVNYCQTVKRVSMKINQPLIWHIG